MSGLCVSLTLGIVYEIPGLYLVSDQGSNYIFNQVYVISFLAARTYKMVVRAEIWFKCHNCRWYSDDSNDDLPVNTKILSVDQNT